MSYEEEQQLENCKIKREKIIKEILNEEDESFFKTHDYSYGEFGIPMLTLELTNAPSNVRQFQ